MAALQRLGSARRAEGIARRESGFELKYRLAVTRLVISVPIVVWGGTMVLKVVERYPGVVYVGAGVLVWTAAKMITGEPLLKPWLQATPLLTGLAYLAIPLVLWVDFLKNHRQLESRIHERLAEFAAQRPQGESSAPAQAPLVQPERDPSMLRVLVPVDGSPPFSQKQECGRRHSGGQ